MPFRVGLTRDFLKSDGTVGLGDIRLDLLDAAPGVAWEFLPDRAPELTPELIAGYDAIILLGSRVTAATLTGADRLAVIARFGVGYDNVDVDACTEHGVLLSITPDAVRRPMATVVLTYILALSLRLLEKDRLTRAGGWADKLDYMGFGLTGRTVGIIGFGNIGREVVKLATPLELTFIAADPHVDPGIAAAIGVDLVDLETLLTTADFVVTLCALTPETHHLLNAERLALMKPTAFLISVARGPVVDQAALTVALQRKAIAGAGLDVFEREPVDPADPILSLDNVIVSPHALCWTDEWVSRSGVSVGESVLAVAAGQAPGFVVNRNAIDTPLVQEKLRRYREGA
ncbi:MAG: dehydrogenase [Chloroflexia bacterium]|nr:dehydrogenase [Chloroflexia bacterium]